MMARVLYHAFGLFLMAVIAVGLLGWMAVQWWQSPRPDLWIVVLLVFVFSVLVMIGCYINLKEAIGKTE